MSRAIFSYPPGGGGGGTAVIPEYTSDPVSPSPEDVWVLRSGSTGVGGKILFFNGLAPAITSTGTGSYTYELSYYTTEGTTIRVPMT